MDKIEGLYGLLIVLIMLLKKDRDQCILPNSLLDFNPRWYALDDNYVFLIMYSHLCISTRFCSYNLVFNKAPNSITTRCLTNNVRLTTMYTQQFSMVVIMQDTQGKAGLC